MRTGVHLPTAGARRTPGIRMCTTAGMQTGDAGWMSLMEMIAVMMTALPLVMGVAAWRQVAAYWRKVPPRIRPR